MQYVQEWPLVLFTLLVQLSVGIILVGQCILRCSLHEATGERVRRQSLVALALFAVAMLISLGHTGTPLHGPFTLLHVGSSWLSREIAMLGVTGLALLWLAWLRFKKPPSAKERPVAAVAVAAGLILIFAMSKVYTQKSIPGWNTPGVVPLFLSSAFMLGALWHGMVLSVAGAAFKDDHACAARPIAFWALAGLVLMAAGLPLALPDNALPLNTATMLLPHECLAWAHAAHALLSGLGVLFMVVAALRAPGGATPCGALAIFAFALLFTGELLGRLVFYLSYSRLGM